MRAHIDLRIGRLRVARPVIESAGLSGADLRDAIVAELTARASGESSHLARGAAGSAAGDSAHNLIQRIVDAIWMHEAAAPLRDAGKPLREGALSGRAANVSREPRGTPGRGGADGSR
jgi:hypothetical protein